MVSRSEKGGRLLALGLIAFLIFQVIISANKLTERKMAVSTTTEYDHKRLMPSISVCFAYKIADYQGNDPVELVKKTLREARQVYYCGKENTVSSLLSICV